MLRALGAKKSEHGTDNIESCRTLTGRRIRHVNDEKKIAEWKAKEPERQAATEKRKQDKVQSLPQCVLFSLCSWLACCTVPLPSHVFSCSWF